MNDSKVKSSGYFDVGTKYSLTKDMLVNTSKKIFIQQQRTRHTAAI